MTIHSDGASASSVTWPDVLNRLVAGERLHTEEAVSAMRDVLAGRAAPVHLGAFLCLLRQRGETVDEVEGFLQAIREVAVPVVTPPDVQARLVDTCGTGGDRSGTINVSTTASFVVAAAGVPVAKHGNRASSSQSGAADVLEALGVRIDLGPEGVAACIRETGIGFCLAPVFHPAFRHAGPVRKELGVPTIMNFLGPLSNPAGATRQIIGVSNAAMAGLLVSVLRERRVPRALVVHGHDGLDEMSTTGPTTVHEIIDGEARVYDFEPSTAGIPPATMADLHGGSPQINAERVRAILAGERGPQFDFVALNAGAGLWAGGVVDDLVTGYERACSLLADGSAQGVLDAFIECSRRQTA